MPDTRLREYTKHFVFVYIAGGAILLPLLHIERKDRGMDASRGNWIVSRVLLVLLDYLGRFLRFPFSRIVRAAAYFRGVDKLGKPETWGATELREKYGLRKFEVAEGCRHLCLALWVVSLQVSLIQSVTLGFLLMQSADEGTLRIVSLNFVLLWGVANVSGVVLQCLWFLWSQGSSKRIAKMERKFAKMHRSL